MNTENTAPSPRQVEELMDTVVNANANMQTSMYAFQQSTKLLYSGHSLDVAKEFCRQILINGYHTKVQDSTVITGLAVEGGSVCWIDLSAGMYLGTGTRISDEKAWEDAVRRGLSVSDIRSVVDHRTSTALYGLMPEIRRMVRGWSPEEPSINRWFESWIDVAIKVKAYVRCSHRKVGEHYAPCVDLASVDIGSLLYRRAGMFSGILNQLIQIAHDNQIPYVLVENVLHKELFDRIRKRYAVVDTPNEWSASDNSIYVDVKAQTEAR